LAPRLLHTSNTVFKKCAPPSGFGPFFWFLSPLLLNPGDGPVASIVNPAQGVAANAINENNEKQN